MLCCAVLCCAVLCCAVLCCPYAASLMPNIDRLSPTETEFPRTERRKLRTSSTTLWEMSRRRLGRVNWY